VIDSLSQDLRYALRGLRRSPGFAAAAILTLALAIGANASIFSLIRGILLRPLPYADAEHLVSVTELHQQEGERLASYPTFQDWQQENRSFDGLVFIRGQTVNFRSPEGPEQLIAGYVSPEFFRVTGGVPLLGRVFAPDEERQGGPDVAVISHALWRRRFGGDPSALGRSMSISGRSVTVIGVMPPGFLYPPWATLWMPITNLPQSDQAVLTARDLHTDSRVIARLRPRVTLGRGESEMGFLAGRLAAAHPAESEGWTRVRLSPVSTEVLGDARPRLLVLQATVFMVLLIGCANLANLSMARGAARARELALRVALGARRRRIVQQLLIESSLLAVVGGTAGVVLALLVQSALRSHAPEVFPRLDEVSVDWMVVLVTLLLSLFTAAAFGLLPALRASRPDLTGALGESGRQVGVGVASSRARSLLVVTEVALAMMLLVGAGLLLRSFAQMNAVRLGFQPDHLLTLRVVPPEPRYSDPERAVGLYQRLQQATASVTGVESVALTNHVPLTGASMPTRVVVEGHGSGSPTEDAALFRTVSPEYFRTMKIPLLAGQELGASDLIGSSPAVVVNQTFARRYWPNTSALGHRVTVFKSVQRRADFGEPLDGLVVGVVGDVRHFGQEADIEPEVYIPYSRNPPRWISLIVRTRSDPQAMILPLRRAVLAVEPDLPVVGDAIWAGFAPLDEYLMHSRAARTLNTALVGLFAGTAVLLAMVGLYGVVAFLTTRREREIAVRIALGAQRLDILSVVLKRTLLLCLCGLVVGTLGALLLTRFMASLLFGIESTDPVTFGIVAPGLAAVVFIASVIPALRASRVDPMISLRSE
jgi:putative ABC transport system permease protein